MADVYCLNCNEPWDTWGVQTGEGDLSKIEYRELLQGKGCPSCKGDPDRRPAVDETDLALAHYESIEGEDLESWEQFCPMAEAI